MTRTRLLNLTLQALPAPLRRTLYSVLGLVGAALAICTVIGLDDLGPITLTQALEAYAFLSAATGGVAVANVGRRPDDGAELGDFDEDVDLSSFAPIGHEDDVFGPAHV